MKLVAGIKNGQIDTVSIKNISDHFKTRKDGEYSVEIKKVFPKKSLPMQRLLWDIYRQVAVVTGYETEEVHSMLAYKFLVNTESKSPYVKSTTTLNVDEFKTFVNSVIHFFVVEKKIKLSLPVDYVIKARLV